MKLRNEVSYKKIGLVGGIGPASTIEYYRELERLYQNDTQINGYPEIVIDSVNMSRHDKAIENKDYDLLAQYLLKSLENLKAAGAEIAAICANTEHIAWDKICNKLPLQVVNLLDVVTKEIESQKYKNVLILGTEWTMASRLFETKILQIGCNPITPCPEKQKVIGKLIYPNLENGILIQADKKKMISIIEEYCNKYSIDAVLLGCTELPLMISDSDINIPTINTTQLHINEIFKQSLLLIPKEKC